MSRIHIPGRKVALCTICQAPADQRHHIDYFSDETWSLIPLCDRHHRHLHAVYDHARRKNGARLLLPTATARYLLDPDRARSLALTGDPHKQLEFADQATPQGEYWRRWTTREPRREQPSGDQMWHPHEVERLLREFMPDEQRRAA